MTDSERIEPEFAARLSALPAEQQQAILSLAGGVSKVQAARAIGISYRTLLRWTSDPDFESIRQAVTEYVFSHQMRTALEAFFDVLEQDRARGEARNARWFLNRTLFADVDGRRTPRTISLNVSTTAGS